MMVKIGNYQNNTIHAVTLNYMIITWTTLGSKLWVAMYSSKPSFFILVRAYNDITRGIGVHGPAGRR